MKVGIGKQICIFMTAWALVSLSAGGCACVVRTYNVSRPEPVYVKTLPPAPKAESQPTRPSGNHVWVKGAWEWNQTTNAWEWKNGSWVVPPDHYVWVDASYEAQGENTVVYTPGHWEEDPANPVPVKDKAGARKPQKKPESTPPATKDKDGAEVKPDAAAGRAVQDKTNSYESATPDKSTGRKPAQTGDTAEPNQDSANSYESTSPDKTKGRTPEQKGDLAKPNQKSDTSIDKKLEKVTGRTQGEKDVESGKETPDKTKGRTASTDDAADSGKTPDKAKGRASDKNDSATGDGAAANESSKTPDTAKGRNSDKKDGSAEGDKTPDAAKGRNSDKKDGSAGGDTDGTGGKKNKNKASSRNADKKKDAVKTDEGDTSGKDEAGDGAADVTPDKTKTRKTK